MKVFMLRQECDNQPFGFQLLVCDTRAAYR
ncbi:hypothetical protein N430_05164 [Pseudomonas sp. CC120222-01a]|nr:hypothetical protein N430_05164 [Pseudomonas sp. CC120222-01a]